MLPTRRVAVDFAKVYSQLALGSETVSGLAAFKKRADDAKKHLVALEAEPATVDFSQYRSVLKVRLLPVCAVCLRTLRLQLTPR